jgi:cysteine desulfurase / selenocysteine lyase
MTTPTSTADGNDATRAETATSADGVPDAAALARWAIEYLRRPPQGPEAPSTVPLPASAAAASIPAWSGLESLARATVARLTAATLVHPELPDVPARVGPIAPVGVAPPPGRDRPHFYFLEELTDSSADARHPPFDVQTVRRDFPVLQTRVHGRPLIWLDNAATTQKPLAVIERLNHFYRHENSNVHRAAHELAARATDAYEGGRRAAQNFLGAAAPEEIIFVRGATEAINLVAQSWGRQRVGRGDEIVISHLEHHANIVPWQMLANERQAALKVVPVDSTGQLRLEELQRLLSDRTRIVSIAHVSNALGTITPVREVVDMAHRAGACVLIDGAQSVSHLPVNVQALDADFYVFSGHKIFGPTGIGVLYGKRAILEDMPPWQGGGSMIEDVTFEKTRYQHSPARFEAGTGSIADAAALGAALEYVQRLGLHNIEQYERELLAYATQRLLTVPGLTIVGTAAEKASVLSLVINGLDTTTLGATLNEYGIAVRAGHHCAQPIVRRFGYEATLRASLAFYNTRDEVDTFVAVLQQLTASAQSR